MRGSGAGWQEPRQTWQDQRVLPRETRRPGPDGWPGRNQDDRPGRYDDRPGRNGANGNGHNRPAGIPGPGRGSAGGRPGGGQGGAPARKPGGGGAAGGGGGAGRGGGGGRPGGGQAQLAQVARGSTLNLVGAGVSALTTVGVTVFVTRQFHPSIAGAFFTATSAFLIVEAVASLGANVGLVYFIARLRSLGEERRIPAILRAAIIPVIVASLILTAVMVLLATPLSHVLLSGHVGKGGPVSDSSVAVALRALALTLPFAALLDTFLGMGRGYRDMRPTVMIDKIARSAAQMFGIMIAAAVGSAALLAPLWALPYVPAAIVAWIWVRRIQRRPSAKARTWMPDVPPELAALLALSTPVPAMSVKKNTPRVGSRAAKRRLANANPRGFWQFTTPRAVASLASITLQRIDIVLVAIFMGARAAAIYTAATRFLVAGQLGNMAISMAAQPRFTELFALGDRRNAKVVYQVTTAWLVLLTWPMYWLSIAYGPEVLAVFGKTYTAGSAVMVILGVSMLVATACGQVDMVLITTGRSSWSLFNGLLAVVVNVGLDLWLIPRYGITGAAIGWAVAITVTNVMPLSQLAAFIKLQPFGRGTVIACGLSTIAFGVIPLGTRVLMGHGFTSLGAGVAAGCVVEAIGLWRFRNLLQLEAMPGLSVLMKKARKRTGGNR